jgi:YD repeat-containing protein
MKIRKSPGGTAGMLSRFLIAFTLLLAAFGANADSGDDICFPLYAKAGAIPGNQDCASIAASRTSTGMGTYFCTANAQAMIARYCKGPDPVEPEQSCPVADPVYPGSGAVTLSSTDFVSGDDLPMTFSRTYRSSSLGASENAMGPVWFHSWQRQLNLAGANNGGSSKVVAYRENGEPVTFNWSSGYWRTAGFTGIALTQNGSGWTLTNLSSDTTETYSAQGVLLSERTRTGFVRTLTYDGSGRLTAISQHGDDAIARFDLTLRFSYDDRGRLVRLTDPANGLTQYGYDTNSNLVSVTWPDGNVR